MFEQFTPDARAVIFAAREEARRLGHGFIGTEHLLLGLMVAGRGPGSQALHERGLEIEGIRRRLLAMVGGLDAEALGTLGIDLDLVRETVEAAFGEGALDPMPAGGGRRLPLTRAAKKVLELSLRETVRLKQKVINDGEILLGLIREGHGIAVQVLKEANVDLAVLREDVEARIVCSV